MIYIICKNGPIIETLPMDPLKHNKLYISVK